MLVLRARTVLIWTLATRKCTIQAHALQFYTFDHQWSKTTNQQITDIEFPDDIILTHCVTKHIFLLPSSAWLFSARSNDRSNDRPITNSVILPVKLSNIDLMNSHQQMMVPLI